MSDFRSFIESKKNKYKAESQIKEKHIISKNEEETKLIAEKFARELKPGSVVALIGELGSGKTTFIKGVCRGLKVKDEVTSPTFTLIHEYTGITAVYHFDFYRLENPAEIHEIGCEEYFDGMGVCLIEWADKIMDILPEKRIEIYLNNCYHKGLENSREIIIRKL